MVRPSVAASVSHDGPVVSSNTQGGELAGGEGLDAGVVHHTHVPLEETVIILDDGVLLPYVLHHSRPLVVGDDILRVQATPLTDSPAGLVNLSFSFIIISKSVKLYKKLCESMQRRFLRRRVERGVQAVQGALSHP